MPPIWPGKLARQDFSSTVKVGFSGLLENPTTGKTPPLRLAEKLVGKIKSSLALVINVRIVPRRAVVVELAPSRVSGSTWENPQKWGKDIFKHFRDFP